jgi:hypothetical protein
MPTLWETLERQGTPLTRVDTILAAYSVKELKAGVREHFTMQKDGTMKCGLCGATCPHPRGAQAHMAVNHMKELRAAASAKTASRSGEDISRDEFAYKGGPKADDLKLPTDTAGRTRNAMARFNQTKGIPSDKKKTVAKRIAHAAKKFGIKMDEFKKKVSAFGVTTKKVGHHIGNPTMKHGHGVKHKIPNGPMGR